MKIQALKKSLVFRFNDAVTSKGEFNNGTTAGGIILQSSFDDSAKQPRWVTIVSSGGDNDPTIFKEGRVVLLPALRWTEASKFEGEKIWKSDSTQVVAYQSGEKLIPHDNYVIFIQKCTNNVRTVNFLPRFSTPLMLKIKVPVTFAHGSHSEP